MKILRVALDCGVDINRLIDEVHSKKFADAFACKDAIQSLMHYDPKAYTEEEIAYQKDIFFEHDHVKFWDSWTELCNDLQQTPTLTQSIFANSVFITADLDDPCFVYDDFVNALRAGGASGLLDECSESDLKWVADLCEKWQQDYLGTQQFPYAIANEMLILSTVLTTNSRWCEVVETELDRAKHHMTPAVMTAIVNTVYTLLAE